jgi:peptidoglycan/xylan/chitin deacetylase (PgdA/CDA1 family)
MSRASIFKTSLDLLFYSGASHALRGVCSGMGAIFMLHHVRPGGGLQQGFAPNSGLEVTPEFLDLVINRVRERGHDLLSLTDAVARIRSGEVSTRPFAVFTLDDGYRDNMVHAWPIFRRHRCPFTIFVTPGITDGVCELWWRGLEAAIASGRLIETTIGSNRFRLETVTDAQKQAAFEKLYWPVRNMGEHEQRVWIRRLCTSRGIDLDAICRAEAMTWGELREIAADPLCEIGAHSVHHYAIANLSCEEAMSELVGSRERIAEELGRRPRFFAFPYGDETSAGSRDFELAAEAGFEAAVTTRKGMIFPAHRNYLTALPRVSLNGSFQKRRYADVLMSGVPFAIWNRFRQINAA